MVDKNAKYMAARTGDFLKVSTMDKDDDVDSNMVWFV